MVYNYDYLKKEVLALTTIDLDAYKENQMKRRIDSLIAKRKITGYDNYVRALKADKAIFDEFVTHITINVSEFYRNPEQWKLLDEKVLPNLISRYGKNLKVWSAACSTGDEPYSLVMALSRHIPMNLIRIYATDLDTQVIEKAKMGVYSDKSIAAVPDDFKKKYFTKIGPSYKISDEIKSKVMFKKHNLLIDTYPADNHLIVCRNVLIYFTEEAKAEVFRKFHKSLHKGGALFLGNTEQIINHKEMGFNRLSTFYYEKPID